MSSVSPTEAPQPEAEQDRRAATCLSVVIPVYRNRDSIPNLLERLASIAREMNDALEVVFVIDGSPDDSATILANLLPQQPFQSRLIGHSRNFGSFAAIRTGLARASGDHIAVMAADLQEPPELILQFHEALKRDGIDLVVGSRRSRADARSTRGASRLFWGMYRRFVQPEVPPGGVDVFACSARFRDHIVALEESNSSLVGLAFWLGFGRATVDYDRLPREHGVSGWTLRKKFKYLSDSVYSFTDLPIRMLMMTGIGGTLLCMGVGLVAIVGRLTGMIVVPGYAATIVVIAFFAALNLSGLGIIGAYVWRAYENTKRRPAAVVMADKRYSPTPGG